MFYASSASTVEQLTEHAVNTGYLDLSSRALQAVPVSITACGGLVSLNLSCNSISHLPVQLCDVITLCELDVSFNKLSELPASIGQLQRLASFKASYNQLRTLPAEVVGLTSLQVLHLNDNQITRLPTRLLDSLVSLSELQLQYNALKYLPVQLGELPSLQVLHLEGNPLHHMPLRQLAEAGGSTGEGIDLPKLRQLLPSQPQPQASPSGSRPGSTTATARLSASRGSSGGIPAHDAPAQGSSPHIGAPGQSHGICAAAGNPAGAPASASTSSASPAKGPSRGQGHDAPVASSERTASKPKPGIDILVIDETGPITAPGPGTPHDAEADADASDVWAKLGTQAEVDSDLGSLSTSEAAALQEVADLPPAAAAVLYRTWDAVRTGSKEAAEGRPLTRGGTASVQSQVAAAAARQLLASSAGRPPKSAARPRTGAPGTASGARRPLTSGSAVQDASSMPFPGTAAAAHSQPLSALAGTAGSFDALPPITFPLTSGVRSMLRRMGSASSAEGKEAADAAAAAAQGRNRGSVGSSVEQEPGQGATLSAEPQATLKASYTWGAGSSEAKAKAAGAAARTPDADPGDSLDVVRQLLGARNPDLLHTLDNALEDDELSSTEGGAKSPA